MKLGGSGNCPSKWILHIKDLFKSKVELTRTRKENLTCKNFSVQQEERKAIVSQHTSSVKVGVLLGLYTYLNDFLLIVSPFLVHQILFYSPKVSYPFSKTRHTSLLYFKTEPHNHLGNVFDNKINMYYKC